MEIEATGGTIYGYSSDSMSINNSTIASSYAKKNGGGIYCANVE